MLVRFIIQTGKSGISSQTVRLQGSVTAGRKGTDILIADSTCSRAHCAFSLTENGEVQVRDLSSTNGTFINGIKTTFSIVLEGDEIRIGNTLIQISCVGTQTETNFSIIHGSEALFHCLPKKRQEYFLKHGYHNETV